MREVWNMTPDFNAKGNEALEVTISNDRLQAYLQLRNKEAAESISASGLAVLLQENGIIHGVKQEALASFAAMPLAYAETPLLAAEGTPPVMGKDGYIDFHFSNDTERMPEVQEDGSVDYRQLLRLNNVSKGQLIAERVLPTSGAAGVAVTGEEVPGKDGKEVRFSLGKNVVIDGSKLHMYALIDGLVTETENGKLNVFPVYEVNGDVDYHIGNIDFIGNVVIRGNVLSGFKIKAAGDIRVTGAVEGAEIEADGSIDISSGIFAGNKGLVKAGVNVKSSFMQEANVFAGEDVIVSQSILHSQVRAGRNVICKGSKGLIVGGCVQAGERITARTVGNTMSTVTVLEAGVAPELRSELQHLRAEVKAIAENTDKTEKALHILDQMAAAGTLTPEKFEVRVRLMSTKRTLGDELTTAKQRALEIESNLHDMDKAKVEIINTVYSGTKIVIGRYTRFVKDSMTRVSFHSEGGDIALSAYH
jgi:uncharacterized protein (DUF342 family)